MFGYAASVAKMRAVGSEGGGVMPLRICTQVNVQVMSFSRKHFQELHCPG